MANLHLSYEEFKAFYGDLGITYWTKYNYLDLDYVGKYNIWDEDWELGAYDTSNGYPITGSQIRTKNLFSIASGKNYYCSIGGFGAVWAFFYDASNNLILMPSTAYTSRNAMNVTNRFFTTPNNAAYMKFYVSISYGTVYQNDIRIYQKAIDFGQRDLGEENWIYNPAYGFLCATDIVDMKYNSDYGSDKPNIFCLMYETELYSKVTSGNTNMAISCSDKTYHYIVVSNSNFTNATEFKQAMKGQILFYQKI